MAKLELLIEYIIEKDKLEERMKKYNNDLYTHYKDSTYRDRYSYTSTSIQSPTYLRASEYEIEQAYLRVVDLRNQLERSISLI